MKKYIKYLALVLVGMVMFSCNKDGFNDKPGYVGISKITFYPVLTLHGDGFQAIAKGSTFADSGATAVAGGASVKVVVSGSVNTNAVGVYQLSYTATNTDGFSASATRYVAVYSTDASAENNDYSGTYLRAVTGVDAIWTKLGPGVYLVTNPGGAATATGLNVFAFNPTGSTITIPSQPSSVGTISSAQESTVTGPGGTLVSYMMQILNAGYGTSVRSFVKQ